MSIATVDADLVLTGRFGILPISTGGCGLTRNKGYGN
jgi:hypothetical protein